MEKRVDNEMESRWMYIYSVDSGCFQIKITGHVKPCQDPYTFESLPRAML